MSRSLIRKNQLHPDIADLVGEYGSGLFISDEQVVYTSGNQTISGNKNFIANQYVFSGAKVSFFANQYLFSGANVSFVDESNNKNLLVSGNRILVGDTISNQSDGSRLQVQDGITFQSTSPTITNRNTLDFYEEGVWSPYLCLDTDTGIANQSYYRYNLLGTNGTYTRIGNLVHIRGKIIATGVGTNPTATTAGFRSSGVAIGNLPFTVLQLGGSTTCEAGNFSVPFWQFNSPNTAIDVGMWGRHNTTLLYLTRTQSAVNSTPRLFHSALTGTSATGITLVFGGTYQTASPNNSFT